jgi:hypothetical protein
MIIDTRETMRLPRFGARQRAILAVIENLRDNTPAPGSVAEASRAREIRALAAEGRLSTVAAASTPQWRTAIRGAVFALSWPVVFANLTRRVELKRGHPACAASVSGLAPDCLDRFYDDVESVVADLLEHATVPIRNLEAWIASRLNASTVDGHRRRRGELGALQRPRLPRWLGDLLDDDPWLCDLAIQILQWVGIRVTAGSQLWPLDAWAMRRAAVSGDSYASDAAQVARDVETVLAAMRTRPKWYADYVERPLGHKQPPVAHADDPYDLATLQLGDPAGADDQHLAELAAQALRAIRIRLRGDEEPAAAVLDVLRTVFGAAVGSHDLDRPPHGSPDYERCVAAALGDPRQADRVVAAVRQELECTPGFGRATTDSMQSSPIG